MIKDLMRNSFVLAAAVCMMTGCGDNKLETLSDSAPALTEITENTDETHEESKPEVKKNDASVSYLGTDGSYTQKAW